MANPVSDVSTAHLWLVESTFGVSAQIRQRFDSKWGFLMSHKALRLHFVQVSCSNITPEGGCYSATRGRGCLQPGEGGLGQCCKAGWRGERRSRPDGDTCKQSNSRPGEKQRSDAGTARRGSKSGFLDVWTVNRSCWSLFKPAGARRQVMEV